MVFFNSQTTRVSANSLQPVDGRVNRSIERSQDTRAGHVFDRYFSPRAMFGFLREALRPVQALFRDEGEDGGVPATGAGTGGLVLGGLTLGALGMAVSQGQVFRLTQQARAGNGRALQELFSIASPVGPGSRQETIYQMAFESVVGMVTSEAPQSIRSSAMEWLTDSYRQFEANPHLASTEVRSAFTEALRSIRFRDPRDYIYVCGPLIGSARHADPMRRAGNPQIWSITQWLANIHRVEHSLLINEREVMGGSLEEMFASLRASSAAQPENESLESFCAREFPLWGEMSPEQRSEFIERVRLSWHPDVVPAEVRESLLRQVGSEGRFLGRDGIPEIVVRELIQAELFGRAATVRGEAPPSDPEIRERIETRPDRPGRPRGRGRGSR